MALLTHWISCFIKLLDAPGNVVNNDVDPATLLSPAKRVRFGNVPDKKYCSDRC